MDRSYCHLASLTTYAACADNTFPFAGSAAILSSPVLRQLLLPGPTAVGKLEPPAAISAAFGDVLKVSESRNGLEVKGKSLRMLAVKPQCGRIETQTLTVGLAGAADAAKVADKLEGCGGDDSRRKRRRHFWEIGSGRGLFKICGPCCRGECLTAQLRKSVLASIY